VSILSVGKFRFSPILLIIFPILPAFFLYHISRFYVNLTLWNDNFHMVCIRPWFCGLRWKCENIQISIIQYLYAYISFSSYHGSVNGLNLGNFRSQISLDILDMSFLPFFPRSKIILIKRKRIILYCVQLN